MRVKRDNEDVVITFNAIEGEFLGNILSHIAGFYRTRPEELKGAAGELLYSSAGCAAGTNPDEARHWREQLHELKLGRLALIESWIRQLEGTELLRNQITLKGHEAPEFVGTLNDHRLFAAAEHGIVEEEMALHDTEGLAALPPDRHTALIQIHFLAWLMEEILQVVNPG